MSSSPEWSWFFFFSVTSDLLGKFCLWKVARRDSMIFQRAVDTSQFRC